MGLIERIKNIIKKKDKPKKNIRKKNELICKYCNNKIKNKPFSEIIIETTNKHSSLTKVKCEKCKKINIVSGYKLRKSFTPPLLIYERTDEFLKHRYNYYDKVTMSKHIIKIKDYKKILKKSLNDAKKVSNHYPVSKVEFLIKKYKDYEKVKKKQDKYFIKKIYPKIKNEIKEYIKAFNVPEKELRKQFKTEKELKEFIK